MKRKIVRKEFHYKMEYKYIINTLYSLYNVFEY